MKRKIAFVGNSSQTMCNFRLGVMSELVRMGYEVVVIAPKDSNITAFKQNQIRLIPVEIDCKGMNPFVDLHLVTTFPMKTASSATGWNCTTAPAQIWTWKASC